MREATGQISVSCLGRGKSCYRTDDVSRLNIGVRSWRRRRNGRKSRRLKIFSFLVEMPLGRSGWKNHSAYEFGGETRPGDEVVIGDRMNEGRLGWTEGTGMEIRCELQFRLFFVYNYIYTLTL